MRHRKLHPRNAPITPERCRITIDTNHNILARSDKCDAKGIATLGASARRNLHIPRLTRRKVNHRYVIFLAG